MLACGLWPPTALADVYEKWHDKGKTVMGGAECHCLAVWKFELMAGVEREGLRRRGGWEREGEGCAHACCKMPIGIAQSLNVGGFWPCGVD